MIRPQSKMSGSSEKGLGVRHWMSYTDSMRGVPLSRKYSYEVRQRAKDLFEMGWTIRGTARQMGVPRGCVVYWQQQARTNKHLETWDRERGQKVRNARKLESCPLAQKHVSGASEATRAAAVMMLEVPPSERPLIQHLINDLTAPPESHKAWRNSVEADFGNIVSEAPDSVKHLIYAITKQHENHIKIINEAVKYLAIDLAYDVKQPDVDPNYQHKVGSTPWKQEQSRASSCSSTPRYKLEGEEMMRQLRVDQARAEQEARATRPRARRKLHPMRCPPL